MEPVSATTLHSGGIVSLVAAVSVGVTAASSAVVIGVLGGVDDTLTELGTCGETGGPGGGSVLVDNQVVDADAMDIARTIVGVVQQHRLPRRAAVLAIATGLVESGLRNLDYGDRDSLGVFQQRPSQGWGSPQQLLNPVYATEQFLEALLAVPDWDVLPPGEAEQVVQRSAFPDRYAPREGHAAHLVDRFWTGPDNPTPPDTNDDAGKLIQARAPASPRTLCRDLGGSDIPREPGPLDPRKVPAGFTLPFDQRQAAAVKFALAQLGKPYVWGGKGPDAYDCSGLMLAAWAAAGIGLPAGTLTQVHAGTPVPSLNQIQPGDLLFIPGSLGSPDTPRHVGMYAGHGLIVNAYDADTGVVLERLSAWTDQIVTIRRPTTPSTPSPPTDAHPQP